jgi:hypothetical protein
MPQWRDEVGDLDLGTIKNFRLPREAPAVSPITTQFRFAFWYRLPAAAEGDLLPTDYTVARLTAPAHFVPLGVSLILRFNQSRYLAVHHSFGYLGKRVQSQNHEAPLDQFHYFLQRNHELVSLIVPPPNFRNC